MATALSWLIPLLLIGFALYFLFSPRVSDLDSHRRLSEAGFALLVGTGVGFYDGFFGPGTGTFFAMGYVALLGYNLRRATAHTKLLNFSSNLAALSCSSCGRHILWAAALPMAAGQAIGWLARIPPGIAPRDRADPTHAGPRGPGGLVKLLLDQIKG